MTTEANKLALNIRHGSPPLEISKGKSAVEIATPANSIFPLEVKKQPAEAVVLDAQIHVSAKTH